MKEGIRKNWHLFLAKGLIAVVFGLVIIFNPLMVLMTFFTIFGIFLIVTAVILIILAFSGEAENKNLRFIEALLFFLTGVITIMNPAAAAGGLMFIIAVWAIVSGVIQITGAIRLRKVIENDIMMFLSGVISVIFGVILSTNLIQGAEILTLLFGLFAIATGIMNIVLSFKLRTL